jgi:hypothetical protein
VAAVSDLEGFGDAMAGIIGLGQLIACCTQDGLERLADAIGEVDPYEVQVMLMVAVHWLSDKESLTAYIVKRWGP